jgi:hypothetical protein
MASHAWKDLERTVAGALGGKRMHRGGNFSESKPDVEHPLFSVECKFRKLLPRLLRLGLEQAGQYDSAKPPLLVIKEKYASDALVVLRLKDFEDLFGKLTGEDDNGSDSS